MILAPATPGDLDAIRALHQASWASAYRGMVPDEALGAPLEDHMARTWASLPEGVTLARDKDRLLGFVRLKPNKGWPYVDNLHVAPDLRGGGVGRALMGAMADQADGRLWLTVLADNLGARCFYGRLGGVEGARMTETLLGRPVTTFPVIWNHLGALRRASR
ncbi:GNAT family N-acetyltransferase [Oceaniglobus trochenteri]|uniref:GNAT family N-acetyltransferase n=1 Tax=Oceaniglobus trochenteri TaxID=2763260 RepID=UPI001CFF7ED9|nr:GNAT family N-acetyltransferase [Oceaniglobus trochenteri]